MDGARTRIRGFVVVAAVAVLLLLLFLALLLAPPGPELLFNPAAVVN
jgi:hypothetical protein